MIGALTAVKPIGGADGLAKMDGAGAASGAGGPSFSDVFADVAANAVQTLKSGEATAISGINGAASTQQVVEAVMKAEQTLQTVIAVRDRLVSAYQEISRMGI